LPRPTQAIRALIFDFGGVLVRTESQEPREQLAEKLGLSRQSLEEIVFDSSESLLLQLGRISYDERWQQTGQTLGLDSPDELRAFRRDFFSGDALDTELVTHIRRARRHYKTALLSNASASLAKLIRSQFQITDCFDEIVISGLVGVMKPDPEIYRLVLNGLRIAPHEAIFVDDMKENVRAAADMGIHAIQFRTREELLTAIGRLLGGETAANINQ
jgi:epoxide hydrolase-like predicted phosphatase